jgi:hypothetical protein
MKNPERSRAERPSIRSYRYFTGILASDIGYIIKSIEGISTWDYAHKEACWSVEYSEGFSSKECFLHEILKFQKKQKILTSFMRYGWFLRLHYLEKGTFFWAETFRTLYWRTDVFMSKISGRNTVNRFDDTSDVWS